MAKMRVYQLAKELQVQSALILELLDRMGQDVQSDLSTLEQEVTEQVRTQITQALNAEKERIAKELAARPMEAPPVAEQPEAQEADDSEAAVAAAADTSDESEAPVPEETPAAPVAAKPESPATHPTADAPGRPAIPGGRQPRVFPARRIPPPSMFTRPRPGNVPGAPPGVPGPGGLPGPPARPGFGRPGPALPGRGRAYCLLILSLFCASSWALR